MLSAFSSLILLQDKVELFRDHLLCDDVAALTSHRKCVRHSCVLKNPQFQFLRMRQIATLIKARWSPQ